MGFYVVVASQKHVTKRPCAVCCKSLIFRSGDRLSKSGGVCMTLRQWLDEINRLQPPRDILQAMDEFRRFQPIEDLLNSTGWGVGGGKPRKT